MVLPRLPRSAQAAALMAALSLVSAKSFAASMLDDIGVTILRSPSVAPMLTGTGIVVATAEASSLDADMNPINNFEIGPDSAFLPASMPITYFNSSGNTATGYPNPIGSLSAHASDVARIIAGFIGIATNVAGFDNYEADFFANEIIIPSASFQIDPAVHVVNQSFVLTDNNDLSQYQLADQVYDNFINQHPNILVVSAVGNGPDRNMTLVQAPAACYNGISVGAYDINPGSTGTLDPVTGAYNGRTGVDISAIGNDFGFVQQSGTSYAAPIVTGVATLLIQAGSLGLAGANTQAASMDARVLKSILMTGATKPDTWTHSASQPLDPQLGAGIVNVYSSYRILTRDTNNVGGMYSPSSRSTVAIGGAHPAATTGTPVGSSTIDLGWAMQNITSTNASDAINDYVLTLPASGLHYVLTATLTWNRPTDSNDNINNGIWSKFNNLDLFLYNGSSQITASTSTVDNVEQIYLPTLSSGTYDLQVLKHGGVSGINPNVVSLTDTYALSWSVALLGDVNWDGVVDILDLTTVANHWQTSQMSPFNGDVNGDGTVDILDFTTVASNWQSGTSNSGSAAPSLQAILAPEPASIGLLLAGSLPLLTRRAKKRRAPA